MRAAIPTIIFQVGVHRQRRPIADPAAAKPFLNGSGSVLEKDIKGQGSLLAGGNGITDAFYRAGQITAVNNGYVFYKEAAVT